MQIIEITRAEQLANELAQFFPSRFKQYPGALVIAATAPIEKRLRAATPSPHSKWPDALSELARELPGNPGDCKNALYEAAAMALGGMAEVEQYERVHEARQEMEAATERLRTIERQPLDDAANQAMRDAAIERRHKYESIWSAANFDAQEAQARKTILDLYGKADCPRDHSLIDCAFQTLARLPVLRELSKIALG